MANLPEDLKLLIVFFFFSAERERKRNPRSRDDELRMVVERCEDCCGWLIKGFFFEVRHNDTRVVVAKALMGSDSMLYFGLLPLLL